MTDGPPATATSLRKQALAARKAGEHAASLDLFRQAAALAPDEFALTQDIGQTYWLLGQIDTAEAHFRAMVEQRPEFAPAHRSLGFVLRRKRDHAGAKAAFARACALVPDDMELLLNFGQSAVDSGAAEEAEHALRRLLDARPDHDKAHHLLGRLARRKGDHATALGHFEAAGRARPDDSGLRHEIGQALRDLGRLDESETAFADAIRLDPGRGPAHRARALLARHRGDHAAALEHFRAAHAADPSDAQRELEIAVTLRDLGRIDEAETIGRRLVENATLRSAALIELARCARQRGDPVTELNLLQIATALTPVPLAAAQALAAYHAERWQVDEAEAAYALILREAPEDYAALIGRGRLQRRQDRRGDAMEWFRRAVAVRPDGEAGHAEMLAELRHFGRLDDARQHLAPLLERYPEKAWPHRQRALIERAAGDDVAERAAFDRAAALDPGSIQTRVEQAMARLRTGQVGEARLLLEAARAIAPAHSGVIAALAEIARNADDLGTALDLFREAARLDPSSVGLQLQIARCLIGLGEVEDGLAQLERLRRRQGSFPDWYTTKAKVLRQAGDFTEAHDLLRAGHLEFPFHVGIWHALRSLEIELGLFGTVERAVEQFRPAALADRGRVDAIAGALALARWNVPKAQYMFRRAAEKWPDELVVLRGLAHSAMLVLDLDTARASLVEAARLNQFRTELRGISSNFSQSLLGQLFDEFRMDRSLIEALRIALERRGTDRLDGLLDVVRDNPGTTPPALLLMVELRRQGAFKRAAGSSLRRRPSPIPRRIVQYWNTTEVPSDLTRLMRSWSQQNPGFRYRLYDEEAAATAIAATCGRQAVKAYRLAREPAMKADLFRLATLFAEGGFYVDADDRCIAQLHRLDPGGQGLIVYQEDLGTLGNNFIAAEPRHPVIGLALDQAVTAILRGDRDVLWLSTGPGLFTRAFAQTLTESEGHLSAAMQDVLVLDRHELLQTVAIHCATSYKQSERHWSRSSFSPAGATRPLS